MAKTNALTEWLDIPPAEQPPNHYRLLGLPLFETDRAKIDAAAEDAMARVRTAAGREHMELAGKVLTMLRSARTCLLNDAVRKEYDARLRETLGSGIRENSAGSGILTNSATSSPPDIDTGPTATAADRARKKPQSSMPMILAAAVAGGGLAAALVFTGVIPLFEKKPKKPQEKNVAQVDPSENEKSPATNRDAKKTPLAPNVAKSNPPRQPAAKPVFLTELTPHDVMVDAPGYKFQVNQRPPAHGLWLHPVKGGTGRVAYKLGKKYRWLQGVAVVPDKSRETRDITVRLIGDGRVLWESQTLRKRGDWQQFTVDVADVNDLAVVSRTASGNYVYAHVALVEPRLLVDPAKPAAVQVAGVTDAGRNVGKTSPVATSEPEKPTNLLELIDAKRDSLKGKWRTEKGSLISPQGSDQKLHVANPLPAEYDLHLTVERTSGDNSLVLSLIGGGRQFGIYIDYNYRRLGKYCTSISRIENRLPHELPEAHHGQLLKQGQPVNLVISVRKDGVAIRADGRNAFRWQGAFSKAHVYGGWAIPKGRGFCLGAVHSVFKISRLELRAAVEPATVDLLKGIDPKRDALAGEFMLENGVLVSEGARFSQCVITNDAPQEYELELRVRREGTNWFGLSLNGGGRNFWAFLDYRNGINGLSLLDGKMMGDNESSKRSPLLLAKNVESQIVCRVDRKSVRVTVDGKPAIDWTGDFSRLSLHPNFQPLRAKQLAIGSYGRFKISQIVMRPLAAKPATVDLLKLIDPQKHARRGEWKFENKKLVCGPSSLIEIPYLPPKEYELHVTATRQPASRYPALHIGLAAAGRQFSVVLDYPGQLNGLYRVDNSNAFNSTVNPSIRKKETLKDGQSVSIVCKVYRDGVKVTVDGRTIIDWSGGFTRLSADPRRALSNPGYLAIGNGGNSTFRFSNIELRIPQEAPSSDKLFVIPDAAAQQKSLALIKDIFKSDYAAATRPQQKAALAGKLFAQARKTVDDETARYVLLREAQRLAAEGGDLMAVLRAVDEVGARFNIDALAEKTDVLRRFAAAARFPVERKAVAEAAFNLAKTSAEAKKFDESLKLLKLAASAAGRARLRSLARTIGDYRNAVVAQQKQLAAAEAAAKTLQTKPDDPTANLIRGRYLCFAQRDWEAGLPMLAKGDDPALKSLAGRELKSPADAKDMIDLADAWYDAALKAKDASQRTAMAVRAASWYREAEPSVTGLYKTKVEKQLSEIARRKLIPAGTAIDKLKRAGTETTQQPKKAATNVTPLYVWEIVSAKHTAAGTNLRVEFRPDGTTNHGHTWTLDGKKFACGWDSGGQLVADGTFARGRWFRGAYFTGRLLMKNATLKSEPAANVTLSKAAGQTLLGRYPGGTPRKAMVDCWEFTAQTRGAENVLRLSVDFTDDGRIIDAGRKIGTWEISGTNVLVKFLDEKLGNVTFGRRTANHLFGRTTVDGKPRWTCQFHRVQQVAIYRAESLGTLTFYSNGRINRPRHEAGAVDMHWCFDKKTLRVGHYETDVSADGKQFPRMKGVFVSGRPLVPPR